MLFKIRGDMTPCLARYRKLQTVFVQIKKVFVQIKNVFVQIKNVFVQIKNVFVQLATFCITPLQQQERGEIISRKFAKCVCPNYNMYLSKLRNVFV